MSVEMYLQYQQEYKALPFTGQHMPYNWGSLPDPLTLPWMPYAQMFEEFARELANTINAFTHNVQSLTAWASVTAPLSDEDKMDVAHEFVDTLATNVVNGPYAVRSRFIFATAHLCHQANRIKLPTWIDDLPLDHGIYMNVADRCGRPWRHYSKLKRRIEAIGGRAFGEATNDFRNKYNHRFSPRFMVGITNLVSRQIDPITRSVIYGFGGMPALELPHVVEVLTRERDHFYSAFEAFQALVQEQEDAIRLA